VAVFFPEPFGLLVGAPDLFWRDAVLKPMLYRLRPLSNTPVPRLAFLLVGFADAMGEF